jgi:hypothetical protein
MKKIANKKFFVAVLMGATVFLAAGAKENPVQSRWADSPLTIDGLVSDWKGALFSEGKKVKAEYAFQNDIDTLYVLFKFKEVKYLSSIEITGMTMWIDLDGKKDKDMGVRFAKKKISAEEYIVLLEKQGGALNDEQKKNIQDSPFYFIGQAEIVDKKGNPLEREKAGRAVKGAAFNISSAQEGVIYEFRLPLMNLASFLMGSGRKLGETVGIGFEWGGLTDDMRKEFMKGGAGAGSGSMGIPEGGRGGGSANSAGFDGASPQGLTALRKMTKKYGFWTTVRLAKGQHEHP